MTLMIWITKLKEKVEVHTFFTNVQSIVLNSKFREKDCEYEQLFEGKNSTNREREKLYIR